MTRQSAGLVQFSSHRSNEGERCKRGTKEGIMQGGDGLDRTSQLGSGPASSSRFVAPSTATTEYAHSALVHRTAGRF
jgi:hypothetical protein